MRVKIWIFAEEFTHKSNWFCRLFCSRYKFGRIQPARAAKAANNAVAMNDNEAAEEPLKLAAE